MVNINVNVQHTLVVPEVEERREKDGKAITEIGEKMIKWTVSYLSSSRIPRTMSLT